MISIASGIRAVFALALSLLSQVAPADPATNDRSAPSEDMLRQPGAVTCAALRSGTYRMITPTMGATAADQSSLMVLDAANLAVTRQDGRKGHWTAQGGCRFRDADDNGDSVDYVVSQAGVIAGRVTVNGGSGYRMVFGFPEQRHAPAELAGQWNLLGLRGGPDEFYADAGSVTFTAVGSIAAATECARPSPWSIASCIDMPSDLLSIPSP